MTQQKMKFDREIVKRVRLNYLLHLPKSYEDDENKYWPMIVYLHGSGERGEDLEVVKSNGIAKIAEEDEDFPFIAVSPQCPENLLWDHQFEALGELINEILEKYKVDKDRVYLTGLSMGGYGTWNFAVNNPQRFAAIAPICGGSSYPFLLQLIKHVPTWAFHGALDDIVPLEESQIAVDTLKEYGGTVKFTIYPDAYHDAWTRTYENPELYKWFLSNKRK